MVENRGGVLFVNSVNMNLPFDKAPEFVQDSVAAAGASGYADTSPGERPENTDSQKEGTGMEKEIKTVDELRAAYPALVNQVEEAAAENAANAERQRIRDIEEMALPGSEDFTAEAKYTNPVSVSEYAKAAMKRAKAQGAAYMEAVRKDARNSGAENVGNSAPDQMKSDEFMDAIRSIGKGKKQ